jgi:dienelactone hydrolase
MLFDFDGHGAAHGRLDQSGGVLQRNLAAAYESLASQPEIDPAQIALLGHSMGSGAVMTAAINSSEQYEATSPCRPPARSSPGACHVTCC